MEKPGNVNALWGQYIYFWVEKKVEIFKYLDLSITTLQQSEFITRVFLKNKNTFKKYSILQA